MYVQTLRNTETCTHYAGFLDFASSFYDSYLYLSSVSDCRFLTLFNKVRHRFHFLLPKLLYEHRRFVYPLLSLLTVVRTCSEPSLLASNTWSFIKVISSLIEDSRAQNVQFCYTVHNQKRAFIHSFWIDLICQTLRWAAITRCFSSRV